MPTIDHEVVSRLAYQLWLDRGQPIGSPEVDWNLAVKFCTQQRTPADVPVLEEPVVKSVTHGSGEVPVEVPPTTPVPPEVPPTKASARRASQPKTSTRLSKA